MIRPPPVGRRRAAADKFVPATPDAYTQGNDPIGTTRGLM